MSTGLPLYSATQVSTFELTNGLNVILAPMDNVEAVCVMTYHLCGVRDDPPDVKGASFLFETLVEYGTENLKYFDRMLLIKKYGGSAGQEVGYDHSIFWQIVNDAEINNALWLESERVGSLLLTDKAITYVKNRTHHYYSRLSQGDVNFRAENWIKSKVLEGTAYQTPVFGDINKIRDFRNIKIRKLYDNFKNLSGMVLVISGKFDMDEVKSIINERFGPLSFRKKKTSRDYDHATPRGKKEHATNWLIEGLPQPFIVYGIRGPSRYSERSPSKFNSEYLYFDMLRHFLLDKRFSQLERLLVHQNKLNVRITSKFTGHIEANALLIAISATKRLELEKAKIAINRRFNSYSSKDNNIISNTDLKTIKTMMELDFKKRMRDLKERSILLAEQYMLFNDPKFQENYLRRLRRTNPADLLRVALRYFKKENRTLLNVYPKGRNNK